MGLLDKIKNALFEVEYVEVEEKPKKEKKIKSKDEKEEKPIAKKIVLPGKREEKVEEIQEEELKDEDFEIRPKDEKVKEVFQDNFNVMDDDDYIVPVTEAPKEEEVVPQPIVDATPIEPIFEEPTPQVVQPVQQQPQPVTYGVDNHYADKDYVREYDSYKEKVYSTIHEDYRVKARESKPYGMDPSYQVSIKEYGSENKDEKSYFRPSPIISPIYGILDKNYRKEDVVTKREVHLSSYARTNVNVDDVRNKAYGRRVEELVPEEKVEEALEKKKIEPAFTVEEDDENLLVDLSDEKKPEVKEITVGDAMEYYHDLGLEYNVDYVDASNKNAPKKKSDDLEEDIKDNMNISDSEEEPVIERTVEITPVEVVEAPKEGVVSEEKVEETTPVVEEIKETPVIEEVEETKEEEKVVPTDAPKEVEEVKEEPQEEPKEETTASTLDDDDNLFDLIDSMYREEDN